MKAQGEIFLLINGWMNYLSLLLAACLGRRRFRPVRAGAASALGALYALAAWMGDRAWRGILPLLAAGFLMAWIAFGRGAARMLPLTAAGGWLLAGGADFLLSRGAGTEGTLLLCGAATAALCLLIRHRGMPACEDAVLRLTLNGRAASLPALRDSGNLLREGITGLPVVAVPIRAVRGLLPPGVDPEDLSTLPPGWRLIRAKTAAGDKTMMCFHPDGALLSAGKGEWPVEAAVMLTDMPGKYALLPEELFRPAYGAKEGYYAGL